MIAALTIGHAGKPDRPKDRGCSYRHPSGILLREVPIVRAYTSAVDDALLDAGSHAVILSDGSYDERSLRAKALGADCLLNCHANAGLAGRLGQRAELFHWPGSAVGLALAQKLAEALGDVVDYPVRVIAAEEGPMLHASRVAPVRSTIDGVMTPSICVEPFFVDAAGADKLVTPDFLVRVGAALAKGLLSWRGR